MKLLIAAVTFAATLGMLFLIEAGKSPKEDYAQIIEALKDENANATASAVPSPTKTWAPTLTPALAPIPTIAPTPSPAPQNSPAAGQTPMPTPTQAPSPSPTPMPVQASAPQSTPTPSPTPESTPGQSEKININTAGLEELDNITGVGLVIGQRIIDHRNTNGPFQKIEDIKNVKGIGDITFEKMKDEITI